MIGNAWASCWLTGRPEYVIPRSPRKRRDADPEQVLDDERLVQVVMRPELFDHLRRRLAVANSAAIGSRRGSEKTMK